MDAAAAGTRKMAPVGEKKIHRDQTGVIKILSLFEEDRAGCSLSGDRRAGDRSVGDALLAAHPEALKEDGIVPATPFCWTRIPAS